MGETPETRNPKPEENGKKREKRVSLNKNLLIVRQAMGLTAINILCVPR
jgi:hypothetical protein